MDHCITVLMKKILIDTLKIAQNIEIQHTYSL